MKRNFGMPPRVEQAEIGAAALYMIFVTVILVVCLLIIR